LSGALTCSLSVFKCGRMYHRCAASSEELSKRVWKAWIFFFSPRFVCRSPRPIQQKGYIFCEIGELAVCEV
jgi:hypothetical protein